MSFFEGFFFDHRFDPDMNVTVRTGIKPEIIACVTAFLIILAVAIG